MKARVKATGEEITILGISNEWGLAQYIDSNRVLRVRTFEDKEIEIISTDNEESINWEQRRYEIAKDVLVSSFSTHIERTGILSYVRSCVQIADILIEELKGGEK